MYCDKGKDDEILSEVHNSSNTQPDWLGPNPIGMGQNQRCFVLFTTFHSILSSGLTHWVHSHVVKVPVSSTKKVSLHDFGIAPSACEPAASTNSSAKAAIGMQASAVKTKSNDALPFGGKSIKTFNYALLFSGKPSFTYCLVVASIRNEDFNGETNDSPAKQCSIPNNDPAIEISLQLCIPIITIVSATLTAHILAITTALTGQNLLLHFAQDDPAIMMVTHAKPKLQLIVGSIQRALSARSMISIQEKLIVMLDSECRSGLIVEFNSAPYSEGVQTAQKHSNQLIDLVPENLRTVPKIQGKPNQHESSHTSLLAV
jgi:hypothetical protein